MSAPTPSTAVRSARPFALLLGLVLLAGALQQTLLLLSALADNPFTKVPVMDARIYWEQAARIAGGDLIGDTPFLSAPLYPYALALLRALGGGLTTVFVVQAFLHLGTAAALARASRRLWGTAAGLTAALLYLTLDDPAFHVTRVLNCTLQAFLVALTWERVTAPGSLSTTRGRALLGVTLGLTALANPTFLLGLPVLALWAGWRRAENGGLRTALTILVPGLLTIAPATLHNAAACGEFIPISAQAGITFYHGNQPGADGTYNQVAGVSADRRLQNLQARARAEAAGASGWRGTDAHFFGRGFSFWANEPGEALGLLFQRTRWLVSGRHYGDVYQQALEAADGFRPRAFLAPVPVAWCVLPALVAFFFLRRVAAAGTPEALLFLLPCLIVLLFWYSPRYRMPAVPLVAALVAAGPFLGRLTGTGNARRSWVVALLIALALGPLNRATGFDGVDRHRAAYEHLAGLVLAASGDPEAGLERLESAIDAGSRDAAVTRADLLRRLGRSESALEAMRHLVRERPADAYARRSLAVALAEGGFPDEARAAYGVALELDATDPQSWSGMGNVLLALGQPAAALERYDRALALDSAYVDARYNRALALETLGRGDEARDELRLVLRAREDHAPARLRISSFLVSDGDEARAALCLRRGLELSPGNRPLTVALAWHLATTPEATLRSGSEALVLLAAVAPAEDAPDPGWLDARAAALAQTGHAAEGAALAREAVALLRTAGLAEWADEVADRARVYAAGRTWHR